MVGPVVGWYLSRIFNMKDHHTHLRDLEQPILLMSMRGIKAWLDPTVRGVSLLCPVIALKQPKLVIYNRLRVEKNRASYQNHKREQ